MKTCPSCKLSEPDIRFDNRGGGRKGKQSWCTSCLSELTVERRKYRLEAMNLYKARRGCIECGNNDPAVLDFHHIEPKLKKFNIGAQLSRSIHLLEQEIEKCWVVCANCHRKYYNRWDYDNGD